MIFGTIFVDSEVQAGIPHLCHHFCSVVQHYHISATLMVHPEHHLFLLIKLYLCRNLSTSFRGIENLLGLFQ